MNPIVVLTVVGLVLAAAVYWFVIRDDGNDKGSQGAGTLPEQIYVAPGSSFSFKYPGTFSITKAPEKKGFVWIGGVGPYDALAVKRLLNVPTPVARIKVQARESLSAIPGLTIVGEGTENRDGITLVRFDVDSSVNGLKLHSQIYQFTAAKVTWQLECGAQAHQAEIDAACARALATFQAS